MSKKYQELESKHSNSEVSGPDSDNEGLNEDDLKRIGSSRLNHASSSIVEIEEKGENENPGQQTKKVSNKLLILLTSGLTCATLLPSLGIWIYGASHALSGAAFEAAIALSAASAICVCASVGFAYPAISSAYAKRRLRNAADENGVELDSQEETSSSISENISQIQENDRGSSSDSEERKSGGVRNPRATPLYDRDRSNDHNV